MTRRELLGGLGATMAGTIGLDALAQGSGETLAPVLVRPGAERARFDHGWLDTRHTFSFAAYRDPRWMGFRQLRVINDDRVVPGEGFGTHPHRDMEIFTWVLDGGLEHRDSMGNGSVIRPGDAQRMTAGTGITHSEFNASQSEAVRFLQIWIYPERGGLRPGYDQRSFTREERSGRLRLVASRDGRDGSITLAQATDIHATLLAPGQAVEHRVEGGRHAWVQVARGEGTINGRAFAEGDGFAFTGPGPVRIAASADVELLVFDLA